MMPACTKKMKHADNDLKLTEKIIEKLTCPVCDKISTPPVKQCSNGHIICSVCWQKCLRCPICREKRRDIRALSVEQMAEGVSVDCEYKNDGCCDENIVYETLELHYDTCMYHRVQCCPIDGCEEMISMNRKGELQEHIENVHEVMVIDECGENETVLRKGMRFGKMIASKQHNMGWSLVQYQKQMFIVVSKQSNEMFSVTVTGLGKQNGFGKFFAELRMKDKNNNLCTWKEEVHTSEERYHAKMKEETCTSYMKIHTKDIIENFATNGDDGQSEIYFEIIISQCTK